MAVEEGRAAIYELDLEQRHAAASSPRACATPVGMAWEPSTGALWTVVNERDGLGDETPPDYLTSVKDGGFYGWPYCYWGQTVDDRVPQDAGHGRQGDHAGLRAGRPHRLARPCWVPAGTLPGFPEGMAIGQHGSWNRSTLERLQAGVRAVRERPPVGPAARHPVGFLAPDERVSYGRPVGVTLGPDGKSLLMADDVGNVIWRVTANVRDRVAAQTC